MLSWQIFENIDQRYVKPFKWIVKSIYREGSGKAPLLILLRASSAQFTLSPWNPPTIYARWELSLWKKSFLLAPQFVLWLFFRVDLWSSNIQNVINWVLPHPEIFTFLLTNTDGEGENESIRQSAREISNAKRKKNGKIIIAIYSSAAVAARIVVVQFTIFSVN